MRIFKTPDKIRAYGNLINEFSQFSKKLADLMEVMGASDEEIFSIIGEGRYNSLSDKKTGYIHYGKYITAPLRGLFGAFVYIHIPELALAKRLPALLGEHGCVFAAEDVMTGKTETWPLQDLEFHFSVAGNREHGRILLAKDLPSDTMPLEQGLPLTSAENSRKWNDDGYRYSIRDKNDKIIHERIATLVCWAHITAGGFKKFGSSSPRLTTLATDGIDDDFTAERNVVECLQHLYDCHDIDLMPYFNDQISKASANLKRQPELVEAIVIARSLVKDLTDGFLGKTAPVWQAFELCQYTLDYISRTQKWPAHVLGNLKQKIAATLPANIRGDIVSISRNLNSLDQLATCLDLDIEQQDRPVVPQSTKSQTCPISPQIITRFVSRIEKMRDEILSTEDNLSAGRRNVAVEFFMHEARELHKLFSYMKPFDRAWLSALPPKTHEARTGYSKGKRRKGASKTKTGVTTQEDVYIRSKLLTQGLRDFLPINEAREQFLTNIVDQNVSNATSALRTMRYRLATSKQTKRRLPTNCKEKIDAAAVALEHVENLLRTKPRDPAIVCEEIDVIRDAHKSLQHQGFSFQYHMPQFLNIMEQLDCDLSRLVGAYGRADRFDHYFGLMEQKETTINAFPAADGIIAATRPVSSTVDCVSYPSA